VNPSDGKCAFVGRIVNDCEVSNPREPAIYVGTTLRILHQTVSIVDPMQILCDLVRNQGCTIRSHGYLQLIGYINGILGFVTPCFVYFESLGCKKPRATSRLCLLVEFWCCSANISLYILFEH
jgi:hypothetical protein